MGPRDERMRRELHELRLRMPPRQPRTNPMGPLDELALVDMQTELAALDEEETMFDSATHPKPPTGREEGVTDRSGSRGVDMMGDTPPIEDVLTFDLTEEELQDIDIV